MESKSFREIPFLEILWGTSSLHVAYLILYLSFVTLLPVGASIFGLVQILKVMNGLSSCQRSKGTNNNIRFRILRNTFIFSILFIIGWGPSGVIMCLTEFPPDLMPDLGSETIFL
ncbi:unnamed protein product [Allacma fusca]|uniref:Uncharacterized protein n=1 Tax=Allacma fusca TaxID=39272 RepID=A0A8J2JV30_9HEXA|nr:unnamed protein product [Allacma fusca]